MTALVIEIIGKHAVLLTRAGSFVKTADRSYRIGQQVSVKVAPRRMRHTIVLAACLLFCLMSAVAVAAERLPFYYVSIDAQASVEMTCNWYDRVLSVHAVNEKGAKIVERLNARGAVNQPLDSALSMVLSEMNTETESADGPTNELVIAVATYGLKNVDSLANHLGNQAEMQYGKTPVTIHTVNANTSDIELARRCRTTAGRLARANEMAAPIGTMVVSGEAWLVMPLRDTVAREPGVEHPLPYRLQPENPVESPFHQIAPTPEPSGQSNGSGTTGSLQASAPSLVQIRQPDVTTAPTGAQTELPPTTPVPSPANPSGAGGVQPMPQAQQIDMLPMQPATMADSIPAVTMQPLPMETSAPNTGGGSDPTGLNAPPLAPLSMLTGEPMGIQNGENAGETVGLASTAGDAMPRNVQPDTSTPLGELTDSLSTGETAFDTIAGE